MEPERVAALLKFHEPPLEGRVRYLVEADRSVIQSIYCGVLFIMAFWSGTSFQSFSLLKKVLERLDPESKLEVIVLDIEGCVDLFELPEFRNTVIGGNGESAWIIGGRILATTYGGSHANAFETYAKHLLNELLDE